MSRLIYEWGNDRSWKIIKYELVPTDWTTLAYALTKDSDLPTLLCGLSRVFDGQSICSLGSNIPSGIKLGLWSNSVDAKTDLNLRCVHMPIYTLSCKPAPFDFIAYSVLVKYAY